MKWRFLSSPHLTEDDGTTVSVVVQTEEAPETQAPSPPAEMTMLQIGEKLGALVAQVENLSPLNPRVEAMETQLNFLQEQLFRLETTIPQQVEATIDQVVEAAAEELLEEEVLEETEDLTEEPSQIPEIPDPVQIEQQQPQETSKKSFFDLKNWL